MTEGDVEVNDAESKRKRRSSGGTIDVDKVDEQFCVAIKPPPPTPAPTLGPGRMVTILPKITNDSINYTISSSNAKCLFWDDKEQEWTSNGCIVSPHQNRICSLRLLKRNLLLKVILPIHNRSIFHCLNLVNIKKK